MENKTLALTTTAVMTAILCVISPFSIPIGPVPVSLCTFAIYITMYILKTAKGTAAVCLYILIGLIGVPVFSGFSGGIGKLIGPTGGYIIGYIPMAFLIGLGLKRTYKNIVLSILVMCGATCILYLIGTAYLAYQTGMTLKEALYVGVIPFIITDFIKIVISSITGPVLANRLSRFTKKPEA